MEKRLLFVYIKQVNQNICLKMIVRGQKNLSRELHNEIQGINEVKLELFSLNLMTRTPKS